MSKWIYRFERGKADGDAQMKNLLGGKGANLAEMSNIGIPVPPGLTITTDVCGYYYANNKKYSYELINDVNESISYFIVIFQISQALHCVPYAPEKVLFLSLKSLDHRILLL